MSTKSKKVIYGLGNLWGILQDEFLEFVDMYRSYLGWVLKCVVGKQMVEYHTPWHLAFRDPVFYVNFADINISACMALESCEEFFRTNSLSLSTCLGVIWDEFAKILQYPTLSPDMWHVESRPFMLTSLTLRLRSYMDCETCEEFFRMSS